MTDDQLPVLPTIDKRGANRKPSAALELRESDRLRMMQDTPGAAQLRQLAEHLDTPGAAQLRHLAEHLDTPGAAQLRQLAEHLDTLREHKKADPAKGVPRSNKVLTVHSKYGQPPGDLGYIEAKDWTPDQQQEAAAWLANEQHKDWWRAQGVAQTEAATV